MDTTLEQKIDCFLSKKVKVNALLLTHVLDGEARFCFKPEQMFLCGLRFSSRESKKMDAGYYIEGQILQCQTYLTKLKSNNEKILALKEKHNKTVATNKEKGFE